MYKDLDQAEMLALNAKLQSGLARAARTYRQNGGHPSASGHAMWNELNNIVQVIQFYVL